MACNHNAQCALKWQSRKPSAVCRLPLQSPKKPRSPCGGGQANWRVSGTRRSCGSARRSRHPNGNALGVPDQPPLSSWAAGRDTPGPPPGLMLFPQAPSRLAIWIGLRVGTSSHGRDFGGPPRVARGFSPLRPGCACQQRTHGGVDPNYDNGDFYRGILHSRIPPVAATSNFDGLLPRRAYGRKLRALNDL